MSERPSRILVVEDDGGMAEFIAHVMGRAGFEVTSSPSAELALSKLDDEAFDLVITDLVMGALGGEAVVRKVKEEYADTEVILLTAHASVDSAVEIMKMGAFDYLRKPILPEEILHAAQKALEMKGLRDEVRELRKKIGKARKAEIIGRSTPMQRLFDRVSRAAPTKATILIEGESGTGKELVARAIHAESPRRDAPFVAVNCGAIPAPLLESELFGHARGAFTGADADREGYFEAAHGGTLFLDEIGEMEPHLQIKLLRVLQEEQVARLGETRPRPVDVRIVAATNKDLKEEIRGGRFRRDLYYRLRVVQIHTPPLRERMEDIPLLALYFVKKYAEKYGKKFSDIGPKALRMLRRYDYPGNVRELENIIESIVVTGRGKTIRPAHLRDAMGGGAYDELSADPDDETGAFSDEVQLVVERFERGYLDRLLRRHLGRISEVAKTSGLSRRTIERKMVKYGLSRASYQQ